MINEIFELNKSGKSRFVEILKRGRKDKLEVYFNYAKNNNINLFSYDIGKESYFLAIIKYLIKNYSLIHNYKEKIQEEIEYFKKNGFNLFIEKFEDNDLKYPLLNSKKINNEIYDFISSKNKSIFLYREIIFNLLNNIPKEINDIEEVLNSINNNKNIEYSQIKNFFNKHKDKIKEPFNLNLALFNNFTKFNNIELIFINELKKKSPNKNIREYLLHNLERDVNNNLLLNIARNDNNILSKIKKIVFIDKMFNEVILKTRHKEEYEKEDVYSFFKNSNYITFLNFLNKIVEYNYFFEKNKFYLEEGMTNSKNYLLLVNYSLKDTNIYYENKKIYDNKMNINFEDKLKSLNIICEKSLILNLLEKKAILNSYELDYFDLQESKNIINRFISKEDISKNINLINIEENYNSMHYVNMFNNRKDNIKKIILLLEKEQDIIYDYVSKQKKEIQVYLLSQSKKILKTYSCHKFFNDKDFLEYFFNKSFYARFEVKQMIFSYLEDVKKLNLNQFQKESIEEFSLNIIEKEEIFNMKKEKMFLSINITNDKTRTINKRL